MISRSLCTSTATKEILDLLFFFKFKSLYFFNKTTFSIQNCGLIYTNQKKETTENGTGPQQKHFQAFKKLIHYLYIIYRKLYCLLFSTNFFTLNFVALINSVSINLYCINLIAYLHLS